MPGDKMTDRAVQDLAAFAAAEVAAGRADAAAAIAAALLEVGALDAANGANDRLDALPVLHAGVWTPTLGGAGSDPTVTYTSQQGYFLRVGNFAHVSARVAWSAISGGSGALRIRTLPYLNVDEDSQSLHLGVTSGLTVSAGTWYVSVRPFAGGSSLRFYEHAGTGISERLLTHLAAAGALTVAGIYRHTGVAT